MTREISINEVTVLQMAAAIESDGVIHCPNHHDSCEATFENAHEIVDDPWCDDCGAFYTVEWSP